MANPSQVPRDTTGESASPDVQPQREGSGQAANAEVVPTGPATDGDAAPDQSRPTRRAAEPSGVTDTQDADEAPKGSSRNSGTT